VTIADSLMMGQAETTLSRLIAYCRANDWAGYDPYDALNSPLFKAFPLLDSRFPRIALTQALKRSPINIRRAILIPKTQNPKALALFLSAFLKISASGNDAYDDLIEYMIGRLIVLRSPGAAYDCWGYSFAWQGRNEIVPSGAPNLVCTTFVATALLDAYEQRRDSRCLALAQSAAEYILKQLYWEDERGAGFSYPRASLRSETHNANFLASALLCRLYALTSDKHLLTPALRVARHSLSKQKIDGSWYYGELPSQRWIDNFHTGYNLCALRSIGLTLGTSEFDDAIRRGLGFYTSHFFCEDGSVKYFHDRKYPIDIHCVAQSVITLVNLKALDYRNAERAQAVLRWALKHMWDAKGYFYYRVLRSVKIRTEYMRWSQAWMVLAITNLLSESNAAFDSHSTRGVAAATIKV
jgi:hypothetical protein